MKIIKILVLIFALFFIVWIFYSPTPPLHKAAKSKDIDVVRELLNSGTDVNTRNDRGLTALHISAEFGTYEIVRLLLEYGADVNAKTMYDVTPLHFAAQGGDTSIAQLLIDNGANVNVKDNKGYTPLLWIRGKEWASPEMIDLLHLHEDALMIWQSVKSEEEYDRAVELLRHEKAFRDSSSILHKKSDKEFQEYMTRLKNLR